MKRSGPPKLSLKNCVSIMPKGDAMEDEWTEVLSDGTVAKFTAQEIAGYGAFFTAQIAGHHVVYSVLLSQARGPFNHDEVERSFKRELSLRKMFRLNPRQRRASRHRLPGSRGRTLAAPVRPPLRTLNPRNEAVSQCGR